MPQKRVDLSFPFILFGMGTLQFVGKKVRMMTQHWLWPALPQKSAHACALKARRSQYQQKSMQILIYPTGAFYRDKILYNNRCVMAKIVVTLLYFIRNLRPKL